MVRVHLLYSNYYLVNLLLEQSRSSASLEMLRLDSLRAERRLLKFAFRCLTVVFDNFHQSVGGPPTKNPF